MIKHLVGLALMNRKSIRILFSRTGFTLIELLVAMAISIILFAATYSAYVAFESQVGKGQMTITGREDARAVMNLMAMEIQMAGFNPQSTAEADVFPVAGCPTTVGRFCQADATTIRFRMDISNPDNIKPGDGLSTGANEDITYTYDAANRRITRVSSTGGAAQPILDNVTAFGLQYWCSTGQTEVVNGPFATWPSAPCTAANSRIVQVQVSLTVVNPEYAKLAVGSLASQTPPTATFTTRVVPRNTFANWVS